MINILFICVSDIKPEYEDDHKNEIFEIEDDDDIPTEDPLINIKGKIGLPTRKTS